MKIRLGLNIASLQGIRQLNSASSRLESVYQRLSTGQRINKASDDAAGLSIADSLRADARIATQAIRNVNDALSLAHIADSALAELTSITVRQLELAEQAANGVYSLEQRKALDTEASALTDEFNRIVESTSFNGKNLFANELENISIQVGVDSSGSVDFSLNENMLRTVGDGTFSAELSISVGTTVGAGVATGDFNGDGFDDLVTSANSTFMRVLISNGDGTFSAGTQASALTEVFELKVGDVNKDGYLDVIAAQSNFFETFLGDGSGSFTSAGTFETAVTPVSTLADLNNDGHLDLIAVRSAVASAGSINYGNGDGTFGPENFFTPSFSSYALNAQVGDLDNDGVNEIVLGGYDTDAVEIIWGAGQGDFSDRTQINLGYAFASDIELGDFDHDGDLEIAVAGSLSSSSHRISILENLGGRQFTDTTFNLGAGGNFTYLEAEDLNGDGELDLAYGNRHVGALLNDGNGNFVQGEQYDSVGGTVSGAFDLGDFNGDGALDTVGRWYNRSEIRIFMGDSQTLSTTATVHLLSVEDARSALDFLGEQLLRVNQARGAIGASTQRFEVAKSNLYAATENFKSAEAQIRDADISQEAAELARLNILQQSATSILAQANQQSALVLQLLR